MHPLPSVERIINAQLDGGPLQPAIAPLIDAIARRHGSAVAGIVLYGSWLRGSRDTLPDFYVLLDRYRGALPQRWHGWGNQLLPPNVYQLSTGGELRAKYATISVDQFRARMQHDFHSYFWARFAQPCTLVHARDAGFRTGLVATLALATVTFVRHTLPILPASFSSRDLWITGLALSYRSELRSEHGGKPGELYDAASGYFDAVSAAVAADTGWFSVQADHHLTHAADPGRRRRTRQSWWLRSCYGKLLSAARLLKAALTFNDPLDYVLWKIERHSGVREVPTERQRRHPLLFAWPLLWRVYRRGGFR